MCELDGSKEVHCSGGARGRNANGGRDRHRKLLKLKVLRGVLRGYAITRPIRSSIGSVLMILLKIQ